MRLSSILDLALSEPTASSPRSLTRFTWVVIAYLAALLAALATLQWLGASADDLLVNAAFADLVATLVVFAFSYRFRNSSFYDPYWSLVPPVLLLFWWWYAAPLTTQAQIRVVLMALITGWWALRLTHNWARGWDGLQDEDWRYRDLQARTGSLYWLVSLFGIHLLPTVWVFIGCLPLYLATRAGTTELGWLDALALLVGVGAIWIERRADNELRAFRAQRSNRAQLLRSGVWAWCRHPNYLGEIGFWLALALFGASAQPGIWWVWLGPLVMVLLFAGLTIRMIEQHLALSKPDYPAYQRQTPMLLPRPWR